MKFLADENIPYPVVKRLRAEGFDITSIYEVRRGITDEEVAQIADREERILITFDKDFGMIFLLRTSQFPDLSF